MTWTLEVEACHCHSTLYIEECLRCCLSFSKAEASAVVAELQHHARARLPRRWSGEVAEHLQVILHEAHGLHFTCIEVG